jgi:hypothetical protein
MTITATDIRANLPQDYDPQTATRFEAETFAERLEQMSNDVLNADYDSRDLAAVQAQSDAVAALIDGANLLASTTALPQADRQMWRDNSAVDELGRLERRIKRLSR